MTVSLRDRQPADIEQIETWLTDSAALWRSWDSPYLDPVQVDKTMHFYIAQMKQNAPTADERLVIAENTVVGMVNREKQDEKSGWWELGILIFNHHFWGKGVGTDALRLWIEETLQWTCAHTLTMTTWSGNERMMRTAQRLGFRECMRVPQVHLVDGMRYDAVRYALLRKDWLPREEWKGV